MTPLVILTTRQKINFGWKIGIIKTIILLYRIILTIWEPRQKRILIRMLIFEERNSTAICIIFHLNPQKTSSRKIKKT